MIGLTNLEIRVQELPDTGKWEHIEIPFTAEGNIHLMLEEYSGSDRIAGNAYFDNITFLSVPIPPLAWLLVCGMGSLVGLGRLRFSKKS